MSIVATTVGGQWALKTGEFVSLVLKKLGALGAGESASPEDYADAKRLIDATLKSMHADGLLWWGVKTADVAFTSSSTPRPSDCSECVHASWNSYPMRVIQRTEYERIQNKQEAGRPEVLFDDGENLHIWPVGEGSVRLTYQRELLSTSQGAEMDMPSSVLMPMLDFMAYRIEQWFDVPPQKLARIVQDGQRARLDIQALANGRTEEAPVQVDYY
jgi:hypothetical protein